jgi:hypothetical protein
MHPMMLGDLSARSMDMSLADLVYLQMRPVSLLRRRSARGSAARPTAASALRRADAGED